MIIGGTSGGPEPSLNTALGSSGARTGPGKERSRAIITAKVSLSTPAAAVGDAGSISGPISTVDFLVGAGRRPAAPVAKRDALRFMTTVWKGDHRWHVCPHSQVCRGCGPRERFAAGEASSSSQPHHCQHSSTGSSPGCASFTHGFGDNAESQQAALAIICRGSRSARLYFDMIVFIYVMWKP